MSQPVLDTLLSLTHRTVAASLAAARETGLPVHAVDATAGNGHDTLFLAEHVGPTGRVFAYDVQQTALLAAERRLRDAAASLAQRVTFILAGHETVQTTLPPEATGNIRAAMFNLGYLPGSDKQTVTREKTTLAALWSLMEKAATGCIISVHAYRGHPGGEEEFRSLASWAANLPWDTWRVAEYSCINKTKNRESLFLIEKLRF